MRDITKKDEPIVPKSSKSKSTLYTLAFGASISYFVSTAVGGLGVPLFMLVMFVGDFLGQYLVESKKIRPGYLLALAIIITSLFRRVNY